MTDLLGNPARDAIRPLRARDRPAVARILESTGNFSPNEIAVALELVDAWLASGPASGYHCMVHSEPSSAYRRTALAIAPVVRWA